MITQKIKNLVFLMELINKKCDFKYVSRITEKFHLLICRDCLTKIICEEIEEQEAIETEISELMFEPGADILLKYNSNYYDFLVRAN